MIVQGGARQLEQRIKRFEPSGMTIMIVGRCHVADSDAKVLNYFFSRFKKRAVYTLHSRDFFYLAAGAMKCRREDLAMYEYVMGGVLA